VPGDRSPGLIDDPRAAAGELRRATQTSPLEPDVSRSATPNRRGWLVPVGAAAATMLAAGALVFVTHRTPPEPAPVPGIAPAGPGIVPAGRAGLIVRDGDLVEVSGPVEDSKMCAPGPAFSGPCLNVIRVPGVKPTDGATLRGRWHPNALSDIRRLPYAPTSAGAPGPGPYLPDTPPCPAPAGGWSVSQDWFDDPVRDYLHAHAEQFAEPFATHSGNARILVVEVVSGDVDRARAALTAIYTENLCVVAAPGGRSIADDDKLQATTGEAVGALMNDRALGIYMAGFEDGKMRVNMLQLTQPLYDRLAAIGLEHLILDPWVRPAGP
jgi:hypothetical protein